MVKRYLRLITSASWRKGVLAVTVMSGFLLTTCWQHQQHEVIGPEMPRYALSGYILDWNDTLPVPLAELIVIQTEVYQGSETPPETTYSDSGGYYLFPELYRGAYILQVFRGGVMVKDTAFGMINFADRELNLVVPAGIQLTNSVFSTRNGEKITGLAVQDDDFIAVTFSDSGSAILSPASRWDLPDKSSAFREWEGLTFFQGRLYSWMVEIDTFIQGGRTYIGSPHRFLWRIDFSAAMGEAVDSIDRGEFEGVLTNWQDLLVGVPLGASGRRLEFFTPDFQVDYSRSLNTSQQNFLGIWGDDSSLWALDTSKFQIWELAVGDTITNIRRYSLFDEAGELIKAGERDLRFLTGKRGNPPQFWLAGQSEIWRARLLP